MRFSTYCTQRHRYTHIHIHTLTLRVRRVFHPQETNSFDKPKAAPVENERGEETVAGGRIEPDTELYAERAEKRPNSPTFSHRLTAPKNRTEPNSKKENSARSVRRTVRNAQ